MNGTFYFRSCRQKNGYIATKTLNDGMNGMKFSLYIYFTTHYTILFTSFTLTYADFSQIFASNLKKHAVHAVI